MDLFKKYKEKILYGFIAAGAISALVYIFGIRKSKSQRMKQEYMKTNNSLLSGTASTTETQNIQSSNNSNTVASLEKSLLITEKDRYLIQDLRRNVTVQKNPDNRTLQKRTIFLILDNSITLASKYYIEYTKQSRKLRRKILMEEGISEKYRSEVIIYNETVERILIESRKLVLEYLDIDYEKFEDSVTVLLEKGLYQEYFQKEGQIRDQIKHQLRKNTPIKISKLKQAIKYQYDILESEIQTFQSIILKFQHSLEQIKMIPDLIGTILNDKVYLKYQIEEEDYIEHFSELSNDPEIHSTLQKINSQITEVLSPSQNSTTYSDITQSNRPNLHF